MQLRSQPIGLRVAEWLWTEHPDLAAVQADAIAVEQGEAIRAMAPQVRARVPARVFEASVAMSAAMALHSDRRLEQKLLSIPYMSGGHLERGKALLAIADLTPSDPNHDKQLAIWGGLMRPGRTLSAQSDSIRKMPRPGWRSAWPKVEVG